MDFDLSDEQRLIRETARAFSDSEISTRARENVIGRALTGINARVPE